MKKFTTLLLSFLFVSISFQVKSQMRHEAGQAIVQIKDPSQIHSVVNSYKEYSLQIKRSLSAHMQLYLLEFEAADETKVLALLRRDPRIALAQFNHIVHPRETLPNDPSIANQWHHVNNGTGTANDADIDSDLAWDITTGGLTASGDTIVVCVLESGNLQHPDLSANAWKNHHEIPDNGIDDDNNGYIDDYDGWNIASNSDNGLFNGPHGSSVLGMIGATGNNETGVSGANWSVKMMVVDGFNLGNEASVVEAYNYPLQMRKLYNETSGAKGAFVVATNASWGLDFGDPAEVPVWAAFYDSLGVYGILNCGATTNTNSNVDALGDVPTAVESDYMIAVTATNNHDNRTFSGYGVHTIDLGAPGENVYTTSQSGYTSTSGTSFASPLTAGVIGLLYSVPCEEFSQFVTANPQGGADLVKAALLAGVDFTGNLFNQTRSGGRLNAYNSLLQLLNNCGDLSCVNPHGLNYQLLQNTDYAITWYAPNDSSSYALRYRIDGEPTWTYATELTDTFTIVSGLAFCSNYEFQVTTECGAPENYFWSQSISLATEGCCEPTTGNEFQSIDTANATLTWDPIISAEAYEIYLLTAEGDYELVGTFNNSPAQITGLEACHTYTALVKPLCGGELELDELPQLTFTTDGCCEATSGNTVANIQETSATVVWEDLAATNFYEIYISTAINGVYELAGGINGVELDLTGLDSCTTYFVKIKPLCEGDLELDDLPAVIFNTSGCGLCTEAEYCTASGENSSDEYIQMVEIGPFTMVSGNDGGYALFEATGWEFTMGETYEFTGSPGFSGWSYDEYFRVWIDINADGSFAANEVVFDAGDGSTGPVMGEFTIPTDAVAGSTRMRVAMKYVGSSGTAPSDCGTFSYGEVEDYCIKLLEAGPIGISQNLPSVAKIYPNPASEHLTIEIPAGYTDATSNMEVFDASGRKVAGQRLADGTNTVFLNLSNGIYICKLRLSGEIYQWRKLIVE